MEKKVEVTLDDAAIMESIPSKKLDNRSTPKMSKRTQTTSVSEETLINCLKNERVIVKHVPKETGIVRDPRHILYGGMAESAVRWFTVPKLTSGVYVNVLTNSEKAYLEEVMGLEYNALSIYNKENNFWDNYQVRLTKQDNILNLSNPDDYIKYKVLLANKDMVAPSIHELEDHPKATYQFVIIHEDEVISSSKKKMNATMQAYMEFGKIQDDMATLRTVIEIIDGRPTSKNSKIEFLQEKIGKLITADAKLFVRVVTDPLLSTKVLIKNAIEGGLISNRGGMLYLKSDGTPLCGDNEEPTLNIAAKFLSLPKNQNLKFSLEAKLKE